MPFDRSKYPADWKAISLRIRKERAGDRCEWCKAPNGEYIYRVKGDEFQYTTRETMGDGQVGITHHIGIKVVLTVAHLNHDTTDNRDENLAALCQRCHLRYDADLHKRNSAETRRKKKEREQLALFGDTL
jgi:hypothetical protein